MRSDGAWGDFLIARTRCLQWLRDEMGESPETICETLRMDPDQVRLILMTADEVVALDGDASTARVAGNDGEGTP